MRSALVLALVLTGCSLASLDDYPDASEVLANVPDVLTEGEAVPLRGTIRGDLPARGLILRLAEPGSGPCVEPACGLVWQGLVELPTASLPQPVDTAIVLPDTLVEVATELDFILLAAAENGYRGSSRTVTVRPAD